MKTAGCALVAAWVVVLPAACERGRDAAGHGSPQPGASVAGTACTHAACGENFVVDAAPVGRCHAGQPCDVAITLVAQAEYHVNDEYPYKFKADDAPGVEFLGTDAAGKNVFSKAASNWRKTGDNAGRMTVSFRPSEGATAASVAGTFKLSICSQQNCKIEAERVGASVTVER